VTEPRWLDEAQQQAWRTYLAATQMLHARLGRELQSAHGLTMNDYEILVRLSDAPERRIRMTDLAELTLLSKSRLSHQITRMEQAGTVRREGCPTDQRGTFAVLTEEGWHRLAEAAPTHVESVRRYLVDVLTAEELQIIGKALGRVVDQLNSQRHDS
jgi:DNA-binding MarR family transcriptional regulator